MSNNPLATRYSSRWQQQSAVVVLLLVSSLGAACSSTNAGSPALGNAATGGTGGTASVPGGAAGTATGTAGTTSAATGGTTAAATGGAATGGNAGVVGGGAGGQASGGASGGTASGGMSNTGGTGGTLDFGDVGTAGDGDRVIDSPYTSDPANTLQAAPVGQLFSFQMLSSESTIYPGVKGAYMRDVFVYVPSQYVPGTPAPVMVVQDGNWAVWLGTNDASTSMPSDPNLPGTANLPRILDNLIAAGELPKIVAIFAANGGGDAEGSQRGLEYDTVSGKFAEYVETEMFPRVISEAQTQLQLNLAITSDPRGRGTLGGSSGGAASFSMAWWHPDFFTRVLSYSGTFVRQASPEDPNYKHGCWSYHDFDPFDVAAPNGVIMQSEVQPLRVWLEVGENDSGAGSGPDSYRDFRLANQRMAASLLAKGYHYHFDLANGAGHVDGNVVAQTLPEAMKWLWRGYPTQ